MTNQYTPRHSYHTPGAPVSLRKDARVSMHKPKHAARPLTDPLPR